MARATLIHDEDVRMWNTWFERAGLPVKETNREGRLFLEGSALLRDATLTGQGVAICRVALIAEDLRLKRLIRLSPITIDDDALYYIRLSPQRERSASIDRVLDWLMSSAQVK